MEQGARKGQWQIWVGMLVGVACLAAVFIFFARPADILASLRHVHPAYLLLGALGVVVFLALRAVRWRFMLAGPGGRPPYGPVFHIQNIGYMLTQLLPLRLGDVARAEVGLRQYIVESKLNGVPASASGASRSAFTTVLNKLTQLLAGSVPMRK